MMKTVFNILGEDGSFHVSPAQHPLVCFLTDVRQKKSGFSQVGNAQHKPYNS